MATTNPLQAPQVPDFGNLNPLNALTKSRSAIGGNISTPSLNNTNTRQAFSGPGTTIQGQGVPMTPPVQPIQSVPTTPIRNPLNMGVQTASASTRLLQQYMDDPNQDMESKQSIMKALQSGKSADIFEQDLIKGGYTGPKAMAQETIPQEQETGWSSVKFPSYTPYKQEETDTGLTQVGKFGANVLGGAANILGGIGNIGLHPVDTAKSIGSLSKGIWDIAGHDDNTEDAKMAKKMYEAVITEKYGSWDNFKNALYERPTEIAGDILTLVSGGAALGAKGAQLQKASTLNTLRKTGATGELSSLERASLIEKAGKAGDVAETLGKVSKVANTYNPYLATPKLAFKGAGKVLGAAGQGASILGETAISQATGLGREAQQVIKSSPKTFKEVRTGEITPETTLDNLHDIIDAKVAEKRGLGKEYEALKTDEVIAKKTELHANVNSTLNEAGVTKTSLPFEDRQAINNIIKYIKEYGRDISKKDLFELRAKISNEIRWDKPVSSQGEAVIKKIRANIDRLADERIPGLKALDEKFAPAIKELEQIQGDLFKRPYKGAKPELNENAISILGRPSNAAKLARVEEIMPGITEKIKAMKAFEDMKNASGIKVGTYTRGAVLGGTLLTGGPVATAITFALTHPRLAAFILEKYGFVKGGVKSIIDKIKGGEKLTPSQANMFQQAIQNADKKEVEKFVIKGNDNFKTNIKLNKKDKSKKKDIKSMTNTELIKAMKRNNRDSEID